MKSYDAYLRRPDFFKVIKRKTWQDWLWQQQNVVCDLPGLQRVFPELPAGQIRSGNEWMGRRFRLRLTPYVLSLVLKDKSGNPLKSDPVWKQVFPFFGNIKSAAKRPDEYSPGRENWKVPREMITPIAQHKYENRVLINTADCCLGYCMYCFRALQSSVRKRGSGVSAYWDETIGEIKKRPEIEEVILSGGDPLVYGNRVIEKLLKDLRGIKTVKVIRIHTRAWTHNPFRIDKGFCRLLKKYKVTGLGVHIVHPKEITLDFLAAIGRVRKSGAGTMLMCDTPLIKGVNDDAEILRELFMKLYAAGVKPYYLSHNMPNIPFAVAQRTSVKKGLRLMNSLKRKISNPAMPEYIITHRSGKKTVPECEKGSADFIYAKDKNGWPVIRFKNRKRQWQIYIDGLDARC